MAVSLVIYHIWLYAQPTGITICLCFMCAECADGRPSPVPKNAVVCSEVFCVLGGLDWRRRVLTYFQTFFLGGGFIGGDEVIMFVAHGTNIHRFYVIFLSVVVGFRDWIVMFWFL